MLKQEKEEENAREGVTFTKLEPENCILIFNISKLLVALKISDDCEDNRELDDDDNRF